MDSKSRERITVSVLPKTKMQSQSLAHSDRIRKAGQSNRTPPCAWIASAGGLDHMLRALHARTVTNPSSSTRRAQKESPKHPSGFQEL